MLWKSENEGSLKVDLFERANLGIFQITPDGKIINVNYALAKILGFETPGELLAQSLEYSEPPNAANCCLNSIKSFCTPDADGQINPIEFYNQGKTIYCQVSVWAIRGQDHEVRYYEGIFEDISERKQSEIIRKKHDLILNEVNNGAGNFLQSQEIVPIIYEVLSAWGKTTQSSRVCIFQNEWDDSDDLIFNLKYEWNADGVLPISESGNLRRASYRQGGFIRWMEYFSENKVITGRLDDLPNGESVPLRNEDIQSILLIPIIVEYDWWGFLYFDSIFEPYVWNSQEIEVLNIAANVIGSAFHRQNVEKALTQSRELFQMVADFTHDWEIWISPEGKFIYSSPSFKKISGYSVEYVQQDLTLFRRIILPEDYERVEIFLKRQLISSEIGTTDFRILTREGKIRWLNMISVPIYRQDGKYLGQRVSNRDITSQKKVDEEISQANAALNRYVEKLERMLQMITSLNQMGNMLQSCRKVEDVYAVIGEYCEKLFLHQSGVLYMYEANSSTSLQAVTAFGEDVTYKHSFQTDECWALRRSQPYLVNNPRTKLRCAHVLESPGTASQANLCVPVSSQGNTLGLLYINGNSVQSTDEMKQLAITVAERTALAVSSLNLQEKLRIQSIIDPLTGLYNRRFMVDLLEQKTAPSEKTEPFSFLIMDIDNFKNYNDLYGHDTGDVIIQEFGRLLQMQAGSVDYAIRYGGDEFVVVLSNAGPDEALKSSQRIITAIRNLEIQEKGRSLSGLTCSLGIACYPLNGSDGEALLHAADKALYRAKEDGKNRIVMA